VENLVALLISWVSSDLMDGSHVNSKHETLQGFSVILPVSSSSMLAPFIMNYLEPCVHCYPVKEWNKMKDICTCKNVRRHLCLKKWWSFGLMWPTRANSVCCSYVENKSIMLQTLRGVKSKIVTQFEGIEILLVPSDKLRPDGSRGSYTDFTLPV